MAKKQTDYDRYRGQQAAISRQRSEQGREIGPLPKCVHPRRRAKCKKSFRLFCETYLAGRFPLAWSADHLKAIQRLETAVLTGGSFAFAMPRGSGKTSLSEAGAVWALLYAHRAFVVLIGATEAAAEELLDSIKAELETNDLLAADFPGVCHPVRELEGIANRCAGQTVGGERTRIEWTQKSVTLPTVAGKPTSGAVLRVTGITGRIRGMKATVTDGEGAKSIRPDLVIIDDPQTDDSARSPTQNAYREKVLKGAVLGLAGPKQKIAAVMPCTVIAPGDMADRILDRQRHPEWNGERTKLLYAPPANEQLWEEYARLRAEGMRAGDEGMAATDFYRRNRAAMDAGARPAWPERFNPDELSAVQNCMNLRIDNPHGFDAEYQNEPKPDQVLGESEQLDADRVAAKMTNLPRGVVPRECTRLTAGVDVQSKVIFWSVTAWDEQFGGAVIDYGTFPPQNRAYFSAADARPSLADHFGPKLSEEALVFAGLKAVTEHLLARVFEQHETAHKFPVEKLLIDSGWQTDTVYQFCRQTGASPVVWPSKGRGIKAGDKPMSQWQRKPGDKVGWNWRVDVEGPRNRVILFDTNSWKSFTTERLRSAPGSRGCLWLYGQRPYEHQLIADHLASEYRVKTVGRGREVAEWKLRPERTENHWLDTVVLSAVAAGVLGLQWSSGAAAGETPPPPRQKRRIDIEDLHAKARQA